MSAYFDEIDVSPGTLCLYLKFDKLTRVRAYVSGRHSTQQALLVHSEQQKEAAVAGHHSAIPFSIYLFDNAIK